MSLTINFERLKKNFNDLAHIGKKEDGGIYRMAFTKAEYEARRWLEKRMTASGLSTKWDGALNIIGKLADDKNKEKPAVVVGSHIDTVPNAGALDGALGVIIGLECLARIKEEGIKTKYPLELVAFSDEEGRFGPMFGSKAFAGQITPGFLDEAKDLDGISLAEAMKQLGHEPLKALEASRDRSTIKNYLELHIEQGPILDTEKLSAGIVTDITGLFKWQVKLSGSSNHAGTTPMDLRKDAFMGLADFAHEIPRIIDENGSDHSRITIGKVTLYPGSANTIPGEVEFSIDARDISEEILMDLKDACRKALSAIARRNHLFFDFKEVSWIAPTHCDTSMKKIIEKNAKKIGMDYKLMPSGAAHDAQMVSLIAPMAMIFVPSKNGISHSPHEWTDWRFIERGANLMLNSIVDIANKDG